MNCLESSGILGILLPLKHWTTARLDDTKENAYLYARILPTIQRNQEKERKKCQEEKQIMVVGFAGRDITDIPA